MDFFLDGVKEGEELKQIGAILLSGWKKEKKSKNGPIINSTTLEPKKPILKESVLDVSAAPELPRLHDLSAAPY